MRTWTYEPGQYGAYVDHGESFEFKLASEPDMELGDEVILVDEEGDEVARGEIEGQQLDEGPASTRWAATVTVTR